VSGEWKWETRETSATDCRDCLYFNHCDGICGIDVYKENLWDYCEYFVRAGAMTLKEIRDRFAKKEGRD